ncbi:MAG TPA: sensor domain-containing diguanylate cyclase [Novosphingobium sp.]|nr:sensor domain-containing diguanylate cyclase [Novosphingobium sp.]
MWNRLRQFLDIDLGDRMRRLVMLSVQVVLTGALVASLFVEPDASRMLTLLGLGGIAFNVVMAASEQHNLMAERAAQRRAFLEAAEARRQVEELFAMTDMLQAAEAHDDAGAVLMATARRLLPDYGGALYVFNNSQDRLDLVRSWNCGQSFAPGESLLPSNCWALKRGKPHINDHQAGTLCCMHPIGEAATVEIPMMARGSVHGLLILATDQADSFSALYGIRRLGRALADSMSLALSNIALREKLRTQSLRDPLTGLYNRRYMEDALERYSSLAERSGGATAVLMIDLDNFKALNDAHGHAKGDAVLRDVASQLVGALRPSDVVARYGGEELVVILPGCGLDDAMDKAELLRLRIEALSDAHATPITASFGVAAVPETSTGPMDVLPMADSALYAAKQAGKNRVLAAERRAGGADARPPLASA